MEPSHTKPGKWAEVVTRIDKDSPLDKKAGEALRKASREFRGGFRFREPLFFVSNENVRMPDTGDVIERNKP